jgi:hypothetical protein
VHAAFAIQRALSDLNIGNAANGARSCRRASALSPAARRGSQRRSIRRRDKYRRTGPERRGAGLDSHHSHGPTADRRAVRGGGLPPTRAQGGVDAHDALSRRPGERGRSAQAAIRDAGQPCSRTGSTPISAGCYVQEDEAMDRALHERIVAILSRANDMTIATVSPDGYRQATTVGYFGIEADSPKAHNIAPVTRSR